jgi:hypothetical protein
MKAEVQDENDDGGAGRQEFARKPGARPGGSISAINVPQKFFNSHLPVRSVSFAL